MLWHLEALLAVLEGALMRSNGQVALRMLSQLGGVWEFFVAILKGAAKSDTLDRFDRAFEIPIEAVLRQLGVFCRIEFLLL